jgi:uncharacterized pyridoxal phosphate-containing UPF0001 family protein
MHEFFNALTGPNGRLVAMVCVFFLGCCLGTVIALLQWRKIEVRRLEAAIKLAMLQRGMSVDEIAQVIRAGQSRCGEEVLEHAVSTRAELPR